MVVFEAKSVRVCVCQNSKEHFQQILIWAYKSVIRYTNYMTAKADCH